MRGIGHEASKRIDSGDGGDFIDGDEGDGGREVGLSIGAATEGGHESESRIDLAWRQAGVAAKSEQIDLLARGAGVVAADAEVAVGVGEDIVAVGVAGDSGLAAVQHGDAGCAVSGRAGGKQVDVCADDRLLATVDVAEDWRAGSSGWCCWSAGSSGVAKRSD